MNKMCSLTDLEVGQKGQVKQLCMLGSIRRRLQDIGVIEGTCIECVLRSPGNDPVAYQIKGAVIALRNEDSKKIIVSV